MRSIFGQSHRIRTSADIKSQLKINEIKLKFERRAEKATLLPCFCFSKIVQKRTIILDKIVSVGWLHDDDVLTFPKLQGCIIYLFSMTVHTRTTPAGYTECLVSKNIYSIVWFMRISKALILLGHPVDRTMISAVANLMKL